MTVTCNCAFTLSLPKSVERSCTEYLCHLCVLKFILKVPSFTARPVIGFWARASRSRLRTPSVIPAARRHWVNMSKYANLSREELEARLEALEPKAGPVASSSKLPEAPRPTASTSDAGKESTKKTKQGGPKPFDFAAHATRHVALLLTYHGWPYSGLAIQDDPRLTTVEGELLKALEKTHLIEPGKGFEGCSYSRCGRTDRGVSGEGQVVNLYVRSCRQGGKGWRESVAPRPPSPPAVDPDAQEVAGDAKAAKAKPIKKDPEHEFPYPRLLNGVLPPSIRVIAWTPVDHEFDSRFSCSYRHYKYPFHLDPSLDLGLMRQAADTLVGEHDFRNFCKLDGSKQILNHSRRVVKTYFDETEASGGMVVFNLIGTAFLWHQVRHVIGALFLIGRGLEDVGLIRELLDVETNPSKPTYHMGDPLPLTLHECGYPEDAALDWRIGGYDGPVSTLPASEQSAVFDKAFEGRDKLERELIAMEQHAELRQWQIGGALRTLRKFAPEPEDRSAAVALTTYPVGGGELITTSKYKKVMDRPRGETPDVVNRKWREAKERQGRLIEKVVLKSL